MATPNQNAKNKKRWPTKEVMNQIYEKNLWGGIEGDFYSGGGSHDLEMLTPYLTFVSNFLSSFKDRLVVCDLGCGDFNVGIQLVQYAEKYIGVDIVADLIARNKAKFQSENLAFHCLDICTDELPKADCVLVRQVMQHLSNAEIQSLLERLQQYAFLLVTEHLPNTPFIPNIDIITGQGTRLKKNSGVDLTAEPFCLKPKTVLQEIKVPVDENSMIFTTIYQNF